MVSPWPALAALLLALAVHAHHFFGPLDSYAFLPRALLPAGDAEAESHFRDSYYQARALFRSRAAAVEHATLYSLPLPELQALDLSIDVAVVGGPRRRADRVLLHMSGTHGVEGFAGSAIQSKLLERLADNSAGESGEESLPTLVLVHAVNPFGFSQLRRFNEHNVDLNRNWMSPGEFAERMAQDPNSYGYMDVYDMLNPPLGAESCGSDWTFWPRTVRYLLAKGFGAIKKAVVSGNYHFPSSLYFGGKELQPSLVLLDAFLRNHVFDKGSIDKVGMIDVHTGLGAPGVDTLMLQNDANISLARKVFPMADNSNDRVVPVSSDESGVSDGYDSVTGLTTDGVWALLRELSGQHQRGEDLLFTQEFGTVPGVFVLRAMIDENALFVANATTCRLPAAQALRDVFYLHQSASWKRSVLARGLTVFDQLEAHLKA